MPDPASFRPAILTPTYNNARTLGAVLDALAVIGLPIIVVNDGSTDSTREVLAPRGGRLTVIGHAVNQGKGAALRTGFRAALDAGFSHVVTVDTDGQHAPADVPALLALAAAHPEAMIIGARRMDIDHYPAKNRLGRRISNLAIRLQTGVRISDSQSGLRVYPVAAALALPVVAGRYGFEAEIITRFAWAGRPILESPITCTYAAGPERVSHFHPVMDSLRALVTHVRLLVLSVLR